MTKSWWFLLILGILDSISSSCGDTNSKTIDLMDCTEERHLKVDSLELALQNYKETSNVNFISEILEISKRLNHHDMAKTFGSLLDAMKNKGHINTIHSMRLASFIKKEIEKMQNAEQLNCMTNCPNNCVHNQATSNLQILLKVRDQLPENAYNLIFGQICLRTVHRDGYLYANQANEDMRPNKRLVWKTVDKSIYSKIVLEAINISNGLDIYRLKFVEINQYLTLDTMDADETQLAIMFPGRYESNRRVHTEFTPCQKTFIHASSHPSKLNLWALDPIDINLNKFYLNNLSKHPETQIMYASDFPIDYWNSYVFAKPGIVNKGWSEFILEKC